MLCNEKVLDLFVTRDAYDLDETWVAPMVSVTVSGNTATVTEDASDWVMPWTTNYSGVCKVGDLVRIGTPSGGATFTNGGFTDYMLVMETKPITTATNGATTDSIVLPGPGTAIAAGSSVTVALTAYRLNYSPKVTKPPDGTIANRHTLTYNDAWAETFSTNVPERKMASPMFKCNEQVGSLQCRLDGGVKGIHFITLMGYTLSTKRRVGFQNEHEMIGDDWLALSIDEVQGAVHSNNPHASGAFAILHGGSSHDNQYGTVEYHRWEPGGLHTHRFSSPTTSMSTLNLKVKDRRGQPAHFGRLHLWFRLGVSHG